MKKKTNNLFFIIVFLQGLVIAGFFSWGHPQWHYSDLENRPLTGLPYFSMKRVLDGSFQKQAEEGLKDQSVLKTGAVKLSVSLDVATFNYDRNGTYFNVEGNYVEKETDDDYSKKRLALNSRIVKRFADQTKTLVDICLIPPKGVVESDALPSYAPYLNDVKIRQLTFKETRNDPYVDLISMEYLISSGGRRYFRTDHHYNAYGAYLASKAFLTSQGGQMRFFGSFGLSTIGDDFHGSLFRKAPLFEDARDQMTVPSEVPEVRVKYRYGSDGRLKIKNTSNSIYVPEYMFTEDKYSVYLGGNHGLTEIENREMKKGPVLFMVKDSFANSAVPYLIRNYKKIVMVDLRYFGGSVSETIKDCNPDRIAVWYESLDFAKEQRMAMVLR